MKKVDCGSWNLYSEIGYGYRSFRLVKKGNGVLPAWDLNFIASDDLLILPWCENIEKINNFALIIDKTCPVYNELLPLCKERIAGEPTKASDGVRIFNDYNSNNYAHFYLDANKSIKLIFHFEKDTPEDYRSIDINNRVDDNCSQVDKRGSDFKQTFNNVISNCLIKINEIEASVKNL